jgi:hypothetical protein
MPAIRDEHGHEEGGRATAVIHQKGIDEISLEV